MQYHVGVGIKEELEEDSSHNTDLGGRKEIALDPNVVIDE